MPGPVSCTEISILLPLRRAASVTDELGWRVFDRILAQVGQDLGDLNVVDVGQGEIGFDLGPNLVIRVLRAQPARHILDQFGQVIPLPIGTQGAPFDPGEVEQVGHHPRQPVRLLVDRLQKVGAGLVVPGDRPVQQGGRRGLDRRQRGAEVVRDRRQQGGFEFVRLGQGSRLGRLFGQARPIQRQGRLSGERAEQADILFAEGATARPSR